MFAGYYRRFIEGYAKIAKPLNGLLFGHPTLKQSNSKRKRSVPWQWGEIQQKAFDTLKSMLSTPPVLAYAAFKRILLWYILRHQRRD